MRALTLVPVVLFGLATRSTARTYDSYFNLPSLTYDYVIVGAGAAGNVLANRLSDGGDSVLVIEAGPTQLYSDENVLAAIAPLLAPTLTPNTPYDWNYTVAPQVGLNNRQFALPRGRLLGGSTSANYMVHHFGSSDDYDKLASLTGDDGWSWKNMRKYIFSHEKIVPPNDGHDTTGQYIPVNHGTTGQVSVSLPGYHQTIDDKVTAASQELAAEFPYLNDTATPEHILGIGWTQQSIGAGVRSSSSTSYLRNANSRPNLSVLTNSQVTRLLPTGFNFQNKKLEFRGVTFATGPNKLPGVVFAKKEVILSAGSIGTPQILLLSGIGPKKDLLAKGIVPLVDLPSVGDNLSDHVLLPNIYNVKGSDSLDGILRDPAQFQVALNEWNTSKTGPVANGVTNQLGFFRLPSNSSIFATAADPASGPKSAHWEMIVSNFWLNPGIALPATGSYLTFISALISPSSRGSVKLNSADPFDKPIIDPRMVTTDFDKFALREAVRAVKRFASASAWSDYIIQPYGSLAGTTDAEIDAHVRELSTTVFHPVGTAAMSSASSNTGVVDNKLKVKGVEGLRVVDASVWPFLPSAHTQGPTYLVAERAADIIKSS